jgi:hypothetical protein
VGPPNGSIHSRVLLQNVQHGWRRFAGNQRDARFDDARLLTRDSFERVAQVFSVIEGDVRDDGEPA